MSVALANEQHTHIKTHKESTLPRVRIKTPQLEGNWTVLQYSSLEYNRIKYALYIHM